MILRLRLCEYMTGDVLYFIFYPHIGCFLFITNKKYLKKLVISSTILPLLFKLQYPQHARPDY